MLQDAEWNQWSDREIGRKCGVDGKTVARIRADYLPKSADEIELPESQKPVTVRKAIRGGTAYTLKTDNIGKKQSPSEAVKEKSVANEEAPTTELEKLRDEVAYLKAMIREVYHGTATIRLYGDAQDIAFDRRLYS